MPPEVSFRGVLLSAVPVPFDERGRFRDDAQEAYVRYLVREPVDGVVVWAHTGRGLHLDVEVADAVLRSWRSGLDSEGTGGQTLIAAAGSAPIDRSAGGWESRVVEGAVSMAERAREGGADALLVYAPTAFEDHGERRRWVADYHRAIAGVGLPLIAFYLYRAAGGLSYTTNELRDILSISGVAAIKMATLDSVCTYQDVLRLVQFEFPDRVVLSGEDRFLGYSLLRGARGALVGMGAVLAGLQKRLVEACLVGPADEALLRLRQVDELGECLFSPPMEGYISRILFALSTLGVLPSDATFDPWHPSPDGDEKRRIARVVTRLAAEGPAMA